MDKDDTHRNAPNPVMDSAQLARIEAMHRGFLYQHLYAVGCIINLAAVSDGQVSVECDEDVEISSGNEIVYIQVKTRSKPLVKSDIATALTRFDQLRLRHREQSSGQSLCFVVLSNVAPGPKLAADLAREDWPNDVIVVSPEVEPSFHPIAPPAWRSLGDAIVWCRNAAEDLPLSTLSPETLVWKLAARVHFASTGQDTQRPRHQFSRDDLPELFEQLVEQLQEFPVVPDDYRLQINEPELISDSPVRLISGFSGAGKTAWAACHARHSSASVIYFDVGDLPSGALAGSLARELAARILSPGSPEAARLPAGSGLDLLRALNQRIDLPEPPLVVIDNIHRIDVESIRSIVVACTQVRLILVGQPWSEKGRLEALLGIESEELSGWSDDTIAMVFAETGAAITPEAAERWREISSGMPLYVKNAATLCVRLNRGDAESFANDVMRGRHTTELAQEAILNIATEVLSDDEKSVTAALGLSSVALTGTEVTELVSMAPSPPTQPAAVLRSLHRTGFLKVFANGSCKLHDAIRLPALRLAENIAQDDLQSLRMKLRELFTLSLLHRKSLSRFAALMRLLPMTGEMETLVDIATTEFFRETLEPSDLKAVLVETANSATTDPSLCFWILDALAFWELQEGESSDLPEQHIQRMESLLNEAHLGDREHIALVMKQMLIAGIRQNREALDAAFRTFSHEGEIDPQLSRILRYNYSTALFHCESFGEALHIAESLYAEYYDVLGIHPGDVLGATNKRIINLLPGDPLDHRDDLKHIADCLNLAAMCLRRNGENPRLTAIHAAKFYAISGSHRSEMKAAQDVADDLIAMGDAAGARQTLEDHVLPLIRNFGFTSNTLDVRGQYAVVLAYCGEHASARREISLLEPYIGQLPAEQQLGYQRQAELIKRIAQGLVRLHPQSLAVAIQAPERSVSRKVGRNKPCPCGSGKKYKKCCLRTHDS